MVDINKPLILSVIRRQHDLVKWEGAWNALALSSPQQSPMLGYAWVAAFLQHCVPAHTSWLVITAVRNGQLVGVLPVVVRPVRVLGLARTQLFTPYDGHTNSGDLLVANDAGAEVLPQLIAAAFAEVPTAVSLTVTRTPEASLTVAAVSGGRMPFSSADVDSLGAYLTVPEIFEDYRGGLSRNFRNNLNKSANKLAKLPDVGYQFMRGADAAAGELPRLMAVEASSWKGQAGSAIANDPATIAFYTTLVQNLAQAGWLEWHFLQADGKTIAGNLAVRFADTVVLWKLGYDEHYSNCSPGGILLQELLKRACEQRDTREINLTTDLPWYDNWQMTRRKYFNVSFVRGNFVALAGVWFPAALRRAAKKNALARRIVDAIRARRSAQPATAAKPDPET